MGNPQQTMTLIEKLLSPPLTTKIYQQRPLLLKSLIPTQKKLAKSAPGPKDLVDFCLLLLDAATELLEAKDRPHLEWCGELVMAAGSLPGFPEDRILLYSRRLSRLSVPATKVVNADNNHDNALTLGKIKAIDGRPEQIKGFSHALGGEIIVVGREKMIDQARQEFPGIPVYTSSECLILKDLSPERREAVVQTRDIFDGILIPS